MPIAPQNYPPPQNHQQNYQNYPQQQYQNQQFNQFQQFDNQNQFHNQQQPNYQQNQQVSFNNQNYRKNYQQKQNNDGDYSNQRRGGDRGRGRMGNNVQRTPPKRRSFENTQQGTPDSPRKKKRSMEIANLHEVPIVDMPDSTNREVCELFYEVCCVPFCFFCLLTNH